MTCRPTEYVAGTLHRTVRAPASCPVCQAIGSLGAHGYYDRDTTDDAGALIRIRIRRFRCRRCRKTVSCLPRFAQPYRIVNSDTIDAYFTGFRAGRAINRNFARLGRYWRCFSEWSGRLREIIGPAFGPAPPADPLALWRRLRAAGRGLAQFTLGLVRDFATTVFGKYRCHRPPALA